MGLCMNLLSKEHPEKEFHVDEVTERIVFRHDGMEIYDPFLSECGRFSVSPSYYGLTEFDGILMRTYNRGGTSDEFLGEPE